MVTKNKKTKIKPTKITKKVDLEEPQESMDKLPEEITIEESETAEGLVHCKSCSKDIEPYPVENNRWRCPDCQKYTQSPIMKGKNIEILKETKPSKDRPYEIHSSRNIKFSGNELAQAEMLIASGVANNFNDLAKKAFNILFLKEKVSKAFGGSTNKMENQEPNPKRTMAQIQDQKLMEAYTKSFDSGNKSDPMMPMMMQMMQMMMDNQNRMAQMQTGGGGQNSEVMALQRKIDDMVHQQEMARIVSKSDQTTEGQRTVKEAQIEIEKMRISGEEKRIVSEERIRRQELETQKEREEKNQVQWKAMMEKMDSKVERITEESKRKEEKTDFASVKGKIDEAKEISSLITGKKDTSSEVAEIAKTAIPKAFEMGSKLLDSQKEQRAMQYQMMQQQRPMPEQPQQMPQEAQGNPVPAPEYQEPESPMPKAEMSPSEQSMSETMGDIYIKPPEENKE